MDIRQLPECLRQAMSQQRWRHPGAEAMRSLLSGTVSPPPMRLFETWEEMQSVKEQIRLAGFVRDAEYCMRQAGTADHGTLDPRLNFDRSVFVAGSIMPGEDVLVAFDESDTDPFLKILDWSKPAPERWVRVTRLCSFVGSIGGHMAQQGSGPGTR